MSLSTDTLQRLQFASGLVGLYQAVRHAMLLRRGNLILIALVAAQCHELGIHPWRRL